MHQYFGEILAYSFFNTAAIVVAIITSFFFVKEKTNELGLYSRYAIFYVSKKVPAMGKILKYFLAILELFVMTAASLLATIYNVPMGELVGTGFNYFGGLFAFGIFWFIASIILMVKPLKCIDIATMTLPGHLLFVKIACFCQGCCWGIPWEYGPYNNHSHHPGNQVPVQAIEAFYAVVIFIFLLVYRKKAKPGTVFPMYMILYSATRFFSEFLTAAYPDVLGPFNMYQILCVIGVVVGLLMLLIVKLFGDRIQAFFEKPHKKYELKVAQREKQEAIRLAEEKAQAESERLERLEKSKLARQKAKARKK